MTRSRRGSKSTPSRPEAVKGYTFDQARADRVVDFIQTFCVMSKGRQWAGRPMELMDWQKADIIAPLFGWVDDKGHRRYRTAAIFTPKKNGKSTLLAALALYFLVADGEPGCEVWGCATDRQSAGIIYREAAAMVRASPVLSNAIEVVDSRNTLLHKASGSRYSVLSSDAPRAEGINAHAVLADEIHAMRDRKLLDALRYAGSARTQPMLIGISTAGYERGKSVAWEWWQDAEKVTADPASLPTFFGKIYAAPEQASVESYFTPAMWKAANPSLGITIPEKTFAADAEEARTNPAKTSAWLRYRMNVWQSADTRFFTPAAWAACGDEPREPLEGRECYGGLDLACTRDMTSVVFCFPDGSGGYDFDPYFFIPQDTAAERAAKDRVPYLEWIRDGLVIATDGNRCDYGVVEKFILDYAERHHLVKLGCDRWNAASTITRLKDGGIQVEGFSQAVGSMSAPTKLLDTLLAAKKIRHRNHPVLSWCASNVAVRTDPNGNIAPCKVRSTEKIDGIVAAIMALGLASTAAIPETSWEIVEL
jgi:phage terminase large subunit-like protein